MNEYVKAALQTVLSVGAFVGLCVLAYNNGEIARDIVGYGVIGIIVLWIVAFIFNIFLRGIRRKNGTYKEPDINTHYG